MRPKWPPRPQPLATATSFTWSPMSNEPATGMMSTSFQSSQSTGVVLAAEVRRGTPAWPETLNSR